MAKPKLDLKDPSVVAAVSKYASHAKQAYELASMRDHVVRPVFAMDTNQQRVRHVGSCVLLTIQNEVFALSASHVFDEVGPYEFLFGLGTKLHSVGGDRFSAAKGPSGTHRDDPIDASVFHVHGDVPAEVRASALTLQDLDIVPAARALEFYVAMGYRVSQSRSTSTGHSAHLDRYPSIEVGEPEYRHYSLARDRHLLLAFEDQVLAEGRWQVAPSIKGMSGGAIFRVAGVALGRKHKTTDTKSEAKLAAILIERKKGASGKAVPVAVGVRLGYHFGLIHKYLPELQLDEMLRTERERQESAGG
jgi:hypothetical protein